MLLTSVSTEILGIKRGAINLVGKDKAIDKWQVTVVVGKETVFTHLKVLPVLTSRDHVVTIWRGTGDCKSGNTVWRQKIGVMT